MNVVLSSCSFELSIHQTLKKTIRVREKFNDSSKLLTVMHSLVCNFLNVLVTDEQLNILIFFFSFYVLVYLVHKSKDILHKENED